MTSSIKMSKETYKEIKQNIYSLLIEFDKQELIEHYEKQEFSTEEERTILINTILYPNDVQIMNELTRTMDVERISKKMNMPISAIRDKGKEFGRYRTWQVLKEDEELKQLAFIISDMSQFVGETILKKIR